MRTQTIVSLVALLLVACERAPRSAADAAAAQAELATDTAQAQLWREAQGQAQGLERLAVDSAAVRRLTPVEVPDRAQQSRPQPFPAEVDAGFMIHSLPPLEAPFSGPVRVASVDGEQLVLDLGEQRQLRLQAKLGGGPPRVRAGESGQLDIRVSGDPFARNDIVVLRLPGDEMVYALVGANAPVRLRMPARGLTAVQTGQPERNMMPVAVTVGEETRTLRAGEQADFRAARLTVKVLASVAVQGEAANALPGEPYRIELLGWRTRAQ